MYLLSVLSLIKNNLSQMIHRKGFLKKQPYDKFFHLGILINDKYAFDKQESYTFVKVSKGSFLKKAETSPVQFNKDITINELVDLTKKRMGEEKFKGYHPLKK